MALFYFLARGQPHVRDLTELPGYSGTLFNPADRREFVDAVSSHRQEPIPLTIDHADFDGRPNQVVPYHKRIGQILYAFLDGDQNVMVVGEIWPSNDGQRFWDDIRFKRKKYGVSFWTDHDGDSQAMIKNVTSLIITHVGWTERPAWGPDGTWVLVVARYLVAIRRVIWEKYLHQPGAYFNAITLQELAATESSDRNLYTRDGGLGELNFIDDDTLYRLPTFYTSVVSATATSTPMSSENPVAAAPAAPSSPVVEKKDATPTDLPPPAQQQPSHQQQTPSSSHASDFLSDAAKIETLNKLHLAADQILKNNDNELAPRFSQEVRRLMPTLAEQLMDDTVLWEKISKVKQFQADYQKKAYGDLPAQHRSMVEKLMAAADTEDPTVKGLREIVMHTGKRTYEMANAVGASEKLKETLSQRDIELKQKEEHIKALEEKYAKLEKEAAERKAPPAPVRYAQATGATASSLTTQAGQLRSDSSGRRELGFGGLTLDQLWGDYSVSTASSSAARADGIDPVLDRIKQNQFFLRDISSNKEGTEFGLPVASLQLPFKY